MASAFSHAIVSVAIGKISFLKNLDKKFWLLGIFCAVIPDADAIGFKLGVAYESVWGHRGITHSFFFAALLAFAVIYFFYGQEKIGSQRWFGLFAFFFFATASHPVLDAMTTGGLGVALLAPFDNTRFFFSFRPIKVSPISITRFFGSWGWEVLKSEFVRIWIPSFVVIGISYSLKKLHSQ